MLTVSSEEWSQLALFDALYLNVPYVLLVEMLDTIVTISQPSHGCGSKYTIVCSSSLLHHISQFFTDLFLPDSH